MILSNAFLPFFCTRNDPCGFFEEQGRGAGYFALPLPVF